MSNVSIPRPSSGTLRQRVVVGFVGLIILVAAGWLSLIIVSRIDELFFPGQGLNNLPSLPGVQRGDSVVEGRLNILVMGLDRRPSEGDLPTRTDTMFVVSVDGQTKTAGLLGIPRDLWVEIPFRDGDGYYEERINTAFVTGEQQDYPDGGAGLVKEVIERNIGISIDHHVIIDFEGFIDIIDELGGIDVYVEEEIDDPFYSRTELPGDYTPLHFDVGMQHMDGQTALDYSRTRFGSSDLDRIRRQQQVIFAAIDKALERNLVDVGTLTDLWGEYKGAIDTDINDLRVAGFASLAAQIGQESITAYSLGVATTDWVAPTGPEVLLADPDMVDQLVQALQNDRELTQEAALVEIQNAAGTDGLAADLADYLGDFGFDSSSLQTTDGADGSVKPLTEIIDFTGKDHTVDRLADILEIASARVRTAGQADEPLRTVSGADVVIVLGADAQNFSFVSDGSAEDTTSGGGGEG